MAKILKSIWVCYFYGFFSIIFLILFPIVYITLINRRLGNISHEIRKRGCRFILFMTGIYWKRINYANVDTSGTYIYCANHSSFLDIIVSLAVLPKRFHFLGKQELSGIPFFGVYFKWLDIPVDRKSVRGPYKAYQQALDDLGKGISVFIFPEATTSIEAPTLLPFKNGAFKLAVESGIPIMPITFLDHWRIFHYDKKMDGRPGRSRIMFGKPLSPKSTDADAVQHIKKETFQSINDNLGIFSKNFNSHGLDLLIQ